MFSPVKCNTFAIVVVLFKEDYIEINLNNSSKHICEKVQNKIDDAQNHANSCWHGKLLIGCLVAGLKGTMCFPQTSLRLCITRGRAFQIALD